MIDYSTSIASLLSRHQVVVPNEAELQRALGGMFAEVGWPFDREFRLSAKDRPDFMVDGRIAIEVKVDGSVADVARQLWRYAQHARVEQLVLITTRSAHKHLPSNISGKRLTVVMDTLGIKRGQLEGIRDPKHAFVTKLQTDPDRIKKLAEAYLEQKKQKAA